MLDTILARHATSLARIAALEACIERANIARWAAFKAPSDWQAKAAHATATREIEEAKAEADL